MRRALRIVIFAGIVAGGTVLTEWWMVPLLAAAWVRALPSDRHPVRTTVVGAALGWAVVLGWQALHGPEVALARRMDAVLELPSWGFLGATLLFPAFLAGAAALLVKPSPPR